jgi:mannan endo-1,4-beta-mannosidase
MKKTCLLLFAILLTMHAHAQLSSPSDPKATAETRALYKSMQRLTGAGIMFGHHDDTAYGVNWKFADDSSDVKSVTGSYPAVYGWDLAKIEHDSINEINGIPFELQKKRVKEAYERGGINTFCWHMDNPANGKNAWDTTQNTIAAISPGGASHDAYVQYLDKAAKYLGELRGKNGEPIPILFRPFHELTGTWFWWGKNTSTPEEFITLWRFTIDYLRNKKKLHNLLIVYSTAFFASEDEYMQRYPGDEYVDVAGFDNYCRNMEEYSKSLDEELGVLEIVTSKHRKLSCIAETGYLNIPYQNWWMNVLMPAISGRKISYIMAWRNEGSSQYYAPYPGQASAADFKDFFNNEQVIFQNRLTPLAVYGKP